LGVPAARVTVFARQMREAGLLSKHGRGMYAARMTARDCAALLVGVAGAEGPADAVAQFQRFHETRLVGAAKPGILSDLGLDDPGKSGVDAITDIIEAVRSGALEEILGQARLNLEQAKDAFAVRLRISHPVRLEIRFRSTNAVETRDYGEDLPANAFVPDLVTDRTMSGLSLVSLGLALRA